MVVLKLGVAWKHTHGPWTFRHRSKEREEKLEGSKVGDERLREALLCGLVILVGGYARTGWAYAVRRREMERASNRQRARKGSCMSIDKGEHGRNALMLCAHGTWDGKCVSGGGGLGFACRYGDQ